MSLSLGRLKQSIGGQAVALAGTTGTAQLILAFLYIVAARSVSPSEFGLFVTAIALGSTAVGFLDFGTNSLWVREIASGRLTRNDLGKRFASKILYSALIFGLWTGLTASLLPLTFLWVAGPIGISLMLGQSLQVPLRGLGRGDLIAFVILVDRILAGLIFGLLLLTGLSPVVALWMCIATASLLSAALCWQLTPKTSRPVFVFRLRTNPWAASGHYGVANVALTAQSLDLPALTLFGSPGAAGIYAAVSRWTQPMGMLAGAFSSAAAPHMAKAETGRDAWMQARKSLWLLLVAVLMCVVTAVFSPQIVELLIGSNYSDSSAVLRLLALATVLGIANQPLFVFLQARGQDRPVALVTVVSVATQLIGVIVLSIGLQAVGAAIAAICGQILLFTCLLTLLVRNLRDLQSGTISQERENV